MKIWHDDIRPAPEGWKWARTNAEAKALLLGCGVGSDRVVTAISLDHDLGLHHFTEQQITDDIELIFRAGSAEETGLDLVTWMIEGDVVPPHVTIHSWNPHGAERMANALNDAGHDVIVAPFLIPPPPN